MFCWQPVKQMHKIYLQEYGEPKNIEKLAEECKLTAQSLRSLLTKAGDRISSALKPASGPFVFGSGTVRAAGIAGTIRLSAQIELEIVPKFLGFSENDVRWKDDFYLLTTLSKHGKLLEGDNIHAGSAFKSSLYDIAGRMLADDFVRLRRNLQRKYRRRQFEDYSIEGEIRFDDSFTRQPNGVPQENVTFDKTNEYNATILAAMKYVQPRITDPRVQRILKDSIETLRPQYEVQLGRPRLNLPGRDLRWKNAYDLAYDIIHGMGAAFTSGTVLSPGFIADTWRIWEWLLTTAVRIGEPALSVAGQKTFPFGTAINQVSGINQQLSVYPDIAVADETGDVRYLVDAKYKRLPTNSGDKSGRKAADRSDIYEALAFCHAAKCNVIFLAYPCEPVPGGDFQVSLVRIYHIGSNTVYAIQVPVGGLTVSGGIRNFSDMLTGGIHNILGSPV